MSKTLFIHVFWNLVKVFLMASGVIAGIMSFGGLLRPLTENGLGIGQVGQMLAYAMPAMTTYSYPIAALFACTVVYGRLAADNEVTAVRAAGISLGPLGFGFPALVLGAIVSMLSLAMLSYLVPAMTLKVERTVVSNIGQFVVNRIEQQHQVRLVQSGSQPLTIYAKSAQVMPPDDESPPNAQVVRLEGVSIVTYGRGADDKKLQIPEDFYIAREVFAYIRQPGSEEDAEQPVLLSATLKQGMKFPRSVVGRREGAIQGIVRTQDFGPFPLRSPLRENTKFMDIAKLQELSNHPERSRRMQELLEGLMRSDQQTEYLKYLQSQIDTVGIVKFKSLKEGDQFTLIPGGRAPTFERGKLVLPGDPNAPEGVRLIQQRKDKPTIETAGNQARLRVYPDAAEKRIGVFVEFDEAVVRFEDVHSPRAGLERSFYVDMPEPIEEISQRTANQYANRTDIPADQARALSRNLLKQNNSVISEMHSRASFAISCLVLTLVGYGLGVMFKSGNYLNAFAVSVVPAIVSIVLIVTGQHICENIPQDIKIESFKNPKDLGLVVIWTGNAIVLALAVVLMVRLRRT